MAQDYPIFVPTDGADTSKQPQYISGAGYEMAVNCQIRDGLLATRWGTKPLEIEAPSTEFLSGNVQGAIIFNPGRGQSSIQTVNNNSYIVVAVAGRRFAVKVGPSVNSMTDITKDQTPKQSHITYFCQAENYLFACDGYSNTWIWDSIGEPFFSKGYSEDDPPNSSVPNSVTVMAYSHGRMVWVANGRTVIVGDIIHKSNQTNAVNLLGTTEQVYWATGASFNPPSSLGNIVAAGILPIKDTQHGHGELMLHCENGIFSIDLNVHPRSSWSDTPMVKTVDLETSSIGPYAVALLTGDQVFRSRTGIESIRSSSANVSDIGNPRRALSDRVYKEFINENPVLLHHSSVVRAISQDRLLSTVGHTANGSYRWARAIMSLNVYPVKGDQARISAEGLFTLPSSNKGIVSMLSGNVDNVDRTFAVCTNTSMIANRNSIIELTQHEVVDTDANGVEHLIESQVVTRGSYFDALLTEKSVTSFKIFFTDVRTKFHWGVWYRTDKRGPWKFIGRGQITGGPGGFGLCGEPYCTPASKGVVLQKPEKPIRCVWIQFLIKWAGWGQLEGFRIMANDAKPDDNKFYESDLKVSGQPETGCNFDPYEYSDRSPWYV